MLRLFAAALCLALGSPAIAALPDEGAGLVPDTSRADAPREDAADVWLRESAPGR